MWNLCACSRPTRDGMTRSNRYISIPCWRILLRAMCRTLIRDLRHPFLWYIGCICFTTLYITLVTTSFHIQISPTAKEYSRIEMEEGDTYDERDGDDVERWLGYRGRNVSRIFYNRVPKCGSETVRYILLRLSWFNDFEWISSTIYLNYTLSIEEQEEFVQDFFIPKAPAIHERHLHYIDFRRFDAEQPLYTNLVREPVDRLVSWYYFVRFQKGHIRDMPDWRRNMTYDECVQNRYAECVSELNYFRVIPFFCGQDYECRFQSPSSLARAKRHLDEHYIVVGLEEDIRNYFVVMEYLLPSFFKDSVEMYDIVADDLKNATMTKKKRSISLKTRLIMQSNLKEEYDFYYFAKQRFYRLLYLIEQEKYLKSTGS